MDQCLSKPWHELWNQSCPQKMRYIFAQTARHISPLWASWPPRCLGRHRLRTDPGISMPHIDFLRQALPSRPQTSALTLFANQSLSSDIARNSELHVRRRVLNRIGYCCHIWLSSTRLKLYRSLHRTILTSGQVTARRGANLTSDLKRTPTCKRSATKSGSCAM